MSLYDFAHDKQPETETIINLRSALKGRAALERFEHLVQGRLIDAGTGVSHFETNVTLLAGDRDMDGMWGTPYLIALTTKLPRTRCRRNPSQQP